MNVYNRVIKQQEGTINSAEAAHRKLPYELVVKHAAPWKLIEDLRVIQKNRDIACGMPARKKLKKKNTSMRMRDWNLWYYRLVDDVRRNISEA